jgi:hypothetical protein
MYLSVEASPCSHAAPSRGGAAPAPAHVISGQKPGLPVQVSADLCFTYRIAAVLFFNF